MSLHPAMNRKNLNQREPAEGLEAMKLEILVPGIPPSVNTYVRHSRGGHYKTKGASKFQTDIGVLAQGRKVVAEFYKVEMTVMLGYKQRGDVDNFAKVVLDGLVMAGVIETDARVIELHIRKARALGPKAAETLISVDGALWQERVQ